MNRNIFRYLRKKVLNNSEFTVRKDNEHYIYTIHSLGFSLEYYSFDDNTELIKQILVGSILDNSQYLKRLEEIENRKANLKILLE